MTAEIRIYADANDRDEQGRFVLSIAGSRKDLQEYGEEIKEGLDITLNVQDEFEVRAKLTFDRGWLAVPDMTSIRYLRRGDEPT